MNTPELCDLSPLFLSLDSIFPHIIAVSEYLQKTYKNQSNSRHPSLSSLPGKNGLYTVPAEIASLG